MISILRCFKKSTKGVGSYVMPNRYPNSMHTVLGPIAAFIYSRLGYIVFKSRSTGTGTQPCSSMIRTISGIFIAVMRISEPGGNFFT